MRTIFIWDIHWCFDEFLNLLEKIKYNVETDKLYLTWDLINKWPKAFELIDFLIKNPQIKSVIGNNEVNFIRYIKNVEWLGIDWDWYLNSENYKGLVKKGLFDREYGKENPLFDKYLKQFSKKHIEYLLGLPLYIENKNWILLHWGLVPWKNLEEQSLDEITRIREYEGKPWYEYYNWQKKIIYGHWAKDGLRFRKNTIWLDSGCVYWKRLSALINTEGWRNDREWWEIIQVPARKVYVLV